MFGLKSNKPKAWKRLQKEYKRIKNIFEQNTTNAPDALAALFGQMKKDSAFITKISNKRTHISFRACRNFD